MNSIKLEFSFEDFTTRLSVSDTFNTENPLFDQLAYYLGAIDHHLQKDEVSIHLTILEKLEILCKKAREYVDEESKYTTDYDEVKVISLNNEYCLDLPDANLYDSIDLTFNTLLKVKRNNKYGVTTLDGGEVLPIIFDDLYMLDQGYVQTSIGGNFSIYTCSGELLYDGLQDISENYNPFGSKEKFFWLKKENKWGLFNSLFKLVIPFRLKYDSCELISDDTRDNIYVKVYKNGKCGLINGLLNIAVLELNREIEDIALTGRKTYMVTKTNQEKVELQPVDLALIENRVKDQN